MVVLSNYTPCRLFNLISTSKFNNIRKWDPSYFFKLNSTSCCKYLYGFLPGHIYIFYCERAHMHVGEGSGLVNRLIVMFSINPLCAQCAACCILFYICRYLICACLYSCDAYEMYFLTRFVSTTHIQLQVSRWEAHIQVLIVTFRGAYSPNHLLVCI